ncbi:MAG: MBOAT family protein [Azonexus sp.]|jgi:D-alanyl-lipoteichoic acid acyltransferase DltB (MBOAT superfamily)|nr:MBOAT family protein [Azonexus sp.]
MLFPTLVFLVFFVAVVILSALCRNHFQLRKIVLTAASYIFYAQWNIWFCILLALSTMLSFAAGRMIAATEREQRRKIYVGLAVALHLGILAFFKYRDLVTETLNEGLGWINIATEIPFLDIALPIGVSFFTFHGISYIVDVYRKDVGVCRQPLDMALYMSFFPQLVAGPIVRAAYFLPQLTETARSARVPVTAALILILFGLFKKMVVADYLAAGIVDPVFASPTSFGGADLLLAVYAYAIQIYCDFSGYTDMAIGLAELLGFRFPVNFRQPYRAQSLQDFWRRWHISLSNWLRDYLYKPLGGSRGSVLKTYRNLFLTMLLGGIWHGAQWKFVAWGVLHGGGLAVERFSMRWTAKSRNSAGGKFFWMLATFHFVCLCWIFFRAQDFATAFLFIESLGTGWDQGVQQASGLVIGLIALGFALQFLPRRLLDGMIAALSRLPLWAQGGLAGAVVAAVEALGPDGISPFIYFQF